MKAAPSIQLKHSSIPILSSHHSTSPLNASLASGGKERDMLQTSCDIGTQLKIDVRRKQLRSKADMHQARLD